MTMDQMVHAGEHDGLFYSLGYSGHGVQMATHMGKQWRPTSAATRPRTPGVHCGSRRSRATSARRGSCPSSVARPGSRTWSDDRRRRSDRADDRDRAARWGVHRGAMADHKTSGSRAQPRERGARRLGRPLVARRRRPGGHGAAARTGPGMAALPTHGRPSPRRPSCSRPRPNASPASSPRRAARPSSRPSVRSPGRSRRCGSRASAPTPSRAKRSRSTTPSAVPGGSGGSSARRSASSRRSPRSTTR